MNCSYCGKEIKDNWNFCMHCGTKADAAEEPVQEAPSFEAPAFEAPAFEAPVFEAPVFAAPAFDMPEAEAPEREPEGFLGRKITIDPEKFEFRPEQQDDPVPKGVSSWELVPAQPVAPKLSLPTKRSLCKMIFLGLVTGFIYPMVIYSRIVTELNIAASRYDGKRTMPFFAMAVLAPLTLSVYPYVWFHKLCSRIGDELQRRCIDYKFGPSQFWLWGILGNFILVGPFIFTHKLMKSMNLINAHYNTCG